MRPLCLAFLLLLSFAPHGLAQTSTRFASEDGTEIDALVFAPAAPTGPAPAVVLLHGCSGQNAARGRLFPRDRDWAERLAAAGFVVVLPDSFGSRGLGQQCTARRRSINPRGRAADAFGALAYLKARGDVDASRIAVMGWSNGGSTTLRVAGAAHAPHFRQAIAFYPGCSPMLTEGWRAQIPTAIFHGLDDDWTPVEPCEALALTGGSVTIDVFAGAHHGFDAPNQPLRQREGVTFSARGDGRVTVGTHEASRRKAIAMVMALLAALK